MSSSQPDKGGEAITYSSADDGKIFQTNPVFSKPSQFKPKGWTDTILGYMREANQWARCILRNRKLMRRPYSWVVHLNLNEELPPKTIKEMWPKVCRKLKDRGIVALWVREPNRLNKCHYHILIKNQINKSDLMKAIEESMPSREVVKWRKRVEPIKKEWRLCHYNVKAKIRGRNKKGIMVEDLYRPKRLLFLAKLKFKKVGTIGDFWGRGKNKKKLWDEIKAIEKQIGEGLEKPNVKRLCGYVYDFLDGYVPLKKIERSYGFWSDSEGVQNWIESLLTDEWAEEDAADNG
ncbi:MAG: hypothetical protein WCH39_12675 [Schlesneria sp.]